VSSIGDGTYKVMLRRGDTEGGGSLEQWPHGAGKVLSGELQVLRVQEDSCAGYFCSCTCQKEAPT